ncbi:MAG: GntR family transcriptional regulator [Anaerolineaceae bacterium]
MQKTQPYQRLQIELERLIANKGAGAKLPSEPLLAKDLGVSRSTLREAMRTFEVQGLIRRRQGQGTFVVGKQKTFEGGLEVLESIETLSDRIGLDVRMGEFQVKRLKVQKENQTFLNFPLKSTVIQIDRIIITEDRPIAYLIDITPITVMEEKDLQEGFDGSVLDWLLKRGNPILDCSKSRVDSIAASSEIAHKMQIQRAAPLLFFASDVYDIAGQLVTHSYSYFIPGFFDFHIVRKVANKIFL